MSLEEKEKKDLEIKSDQHLKKMKEIQDSIIKLKEFEEMKIKEILEYKLDKVIEKQPKLEHQEEEKETIIRLKRKRDDEVLTELYIDFKTKKVKQPTIDSISENLKNVKIEKEHVQKFTLQRKNFKDISGIFDKTQEKVREGNQKARENVKLVKLSQIRKENKNIIELSTEGAIKEEDAVYDYYVFESRIERQEQFPVYIFDEELDFENEYDEEEKYEDEFDENDENNPEFDYPDEEASGDDSQLEMEEFYRDENSEEEGYENTESEDYSE